MNNTRRAKLTTARGLVEQAKELIAQAASEEREYFYSLPELILGDRAQTADAVATALEKADGNIEDVLTTLDIIGVDVIGDLDRLNQAGKIVAAKIDSVSDVPPDARG